MKLDVWFFMDLGSEFVYTAATLLSGYMAAHGALVMPSGAAWLAAGIAGLLGAANHLRALRKAAP